MLSNFRFAYQINFAHMQIFLKVIDNSQKKDYDNTKEFDKSISLKWGVVMETIPKYREIMDYIQEQNSKSCLPAECQASHGTGAVWTVWRQPPHGCKGAR